MPTRKHCWNGFATITIAAALAGCATINDGTSQTLNLNVTPVDASCTAWRDDKMVGIYYPSFQTMKVRKSRNELTILCSAPGYRDARVKLQAAEPEWQYPVSDAVDYATGAISVYNSTVDIVLTASPPA